MIAGACVAVAGDVHASQFSASDQTVKLSGWVYDDAEPLRGATVTIFQKGKRIASGACDSNGKFKIRWRKTRGRFSFENVVLRADYAGYYPREYSLKSFSALDQIIISLSPTLASHSKSQTSIGALLQ
jgi:hypothetical protein